MQKNTIDYERLVVELAISGMRNSEIAVETGLDTKTIDSIKRDNIHLIRAKQNEMNGRMIDGTPVLKGRIWHGNISTGSRGRT